MVAKLVILGTLFLTSSILARRALILGILSSLSLILALWFLKTALSTPSLNFFQSKRTGFNLSASNSAYFSTSNFELAKSSFSLNCDVFTSVAFFKPDFII